MDPWLEICSGLVGQTGVAHLLGLGGLLSVLPMVGRAGEAMAIAEETVAAARAHGNPYLIAFTCYGYGQAFAQADPARALRAVCEGLVEARENRVPVFEALLAREAARLEAAHGSLEQALSLLDTAIDSFHRSGNIANLTETLAILAVLFDRAQMPQVAATLYGAVAHHASTHTVTELPRSVDHLRTAVGADAFDAYASTGAAMDLADAVDFARHQIHLARRQPEATT